MNKKIKSKAGKKTTEREVKKAMKKAVKNPITISKMPTKKVVGLKITKSTEPMVINKAIARKRAAKAGYDAAMKLPRGSGLKNAAFKLLEAEDKEMSKQGYGISITDRPSMNRIHKANANPKRDIYTRKKGTKSKVTGVKTKTVGGFIRVTNEENGGRYGFTKKRK